MSYERKPFFQTLISYSPSSRLPFFETLKVSPRIASPVLSCDFVYDLCLVCWLLFGTGWCRCGGNACRVSDDETTRW